MDYPALSLDDPKTQGILALAAGLMKAGGPSPYPVSFGSAFGQGAASGLGQFNSSLDMQRKNQQTNAIIGLEKSKTEMEAQKLRQAQAQFDFQQGILRNAGLIGGPQTPQQSTGLMPTGDPTTTGTAPWATLSVRS
jgi:hypothetical protein